MNDRENRDRENPDGAVPGGDWADGASAGAADGAGAGAAAVSCPYCGAAVELLIDVGGGRVQEYIEDCEVCCQPWSVRVAVGPASGASVSLRTLDEG